MQKEVVVFYGQSGSGVHGHVYFFIDIHTSESIDRLAQQKGDFIKERFSLIHQDSIDEISESPIGRAFTVHKVFIADIDFAIVFHLSERDASFIHKPEQNRFQHIDGIISDSSQLMSREFAQIFA